jgi:serine protease
MTLRKSLLALVIAGACAPTFAATIDLGALNDATLSAKPRFIVKYKAGTAPSTQATARQQSLDAAAKRAQPNVVQATANGKVVPLHMDTLRAMARGGRHVIRASQRLTSTEAETLMRSIAADPNVEYVAVDGRVHADALPNDPYLATYQNWHYGAGPGGARVTTAWDITKGAGVVVAVIDTGATHHADLEPNLLPGYDFITDAHSSRAAPTTRAFRAVGTRAITTRPASAAPARQARNSSWHGTHVSGTIAEVTNNGLAGAGVAPDARIVPIRVLGRCGGYDSDIADAMVWAAGGDVPGVPTNPNPAEVLSLSLGGDQACPAYVQDAINTGGLARCGRRRRGGQPERRCIHAFAGRLRERHHRRRHRLTAASARAIRTTVRRSRSPHRAARAPKVRRTVTSGRRSTPASRCRAPMRSVVTPARRWPRRMCPASSR